jgi:PAS domain S-box-containing protein
VERARIRVDRDGRYLEANGQALELLGVTEDELLELDISAFTPPEYRDVVMEAWRVRATTGPIRAAGTTTLRPRAGSPIGIEYENVRKPDGTYVSTFAAIGEPPPPSSFVSLLALMLTAVGEAEHQMEGLPADAPERVRLEADISGLRYAYELMVRARLGSG